jgi:hypothetical protein
MIVSSTQASILINSIGGSLEPPPLVFINKSINVLWSGGGLAWCESEPFKRNKHLLVYWKSPRGGVNRANLKFINLSTITSWVSVRNMNESERESEKTNHKQIKSETQGFVLPRFGSCKPTPCWGGHKDRVSFNPLHLSNGHLDRVSFSSQSNGTQSLRKDHHTIGVSCIGYNWVDHKKEWEKEAIQAQELKWTQVTLSLVTIW